MEGLVDPLTASAVQRYVDTIQCDNFGTIITDIQVHLGRQLTKEEICYLPPALRSRRMNAASISRQSDSILLNISPGQSTSVGNVLMVTAYSNDYSIGSLCEQVNRRYAEQHGYEFISEMLPLDVISEAIYPKKHCTWYKIALLRKLFADLPYLESKRIQYVAWIDADAIVVDHSIRLTDIIKKCGGRDLIVAEDMNTGCLINAGVFMLRTTGWSRDFIDDVWDCAKYDDVTFYEQSAMVRVLRARKEDLESVSPFHSYLPNAPQGIKLFPHTAVLPLAEFNSNRGILCNDVKKFEAHVLSLRRDGDRTVPAVLHSAACIERVNTEDSASAGASGATTFVPSTPADAALVLAGGVRCSNGSRKATSKKLVVPNLCYRACGNFCTLCQRTVGTNLKRAAGATVDNNPSLFVYHPAGMPDKLSLLCTALHKYNVPFDIEGDSMDLIFPDGGGSQGATIGSSGGCSLVSPEPVRLIRGKKGRVPPVDPPSVMAQQI